jgi:hypothetical protein
VRIVVKGDGRINDVRKVGEGDRKWFCDAKLLVIKHNDVNVQNSPPVYFISSRPSEFAQ